MASLLSWYGALADHHPRAVFALSALLGCAGVVSILAPFLIGRADGSPKHRKHRAF